MLIVNARKARVVFSELLSEAEHGAVVSITRRGREVADMQESLPAFVQVRMYC
jgi:antitoxin (DNA-binding transcriptional repressor) of toxin-antitoxin stability system